MPFTHLLFTFSRRLVLISLALLLLAGCAPNLADPPRRANQEAWADQPPILSGEPVILPVPSPTPGDMIIVGETAVTQTTSARPTITIWVNETSPAHAQALNQIVDNFNANHDLHVEALLVTPKLLPQLVSAATISNTLPDLILHPVEYSAGWAQSGVLNAEAASGVIDQLGANTFEPGALDLVRLPSGLNAAVPQDGWQQLLVYRADWFTERGLATPDNFAAIMAATEAIFEPDSVISGLVVPTESDLISTHQIFEQIALANGCELISAEGEVIFLQPACLEALEFYREIINEYSPIGVQTDTSVLNAYLAGRTGLIMGSPTILPRLAGLDSISRPSCPECATTDYLAQNSGFVTIITGSGDLAGRARFSEVTYWGITRQANQTGVEQFLDYWYNEAYLDWLAVNPERKVPMRPGTAVDNGHFYRAWRQLPLVPGGPTLEAVYGAALVDQISQDVAQSDRWGLPEQGSLMAAVYENLTFSIMLQEMLSGYFNSSQSVVEGYLRVVGLIPDYPFEMQVTSSEE
jgi:multiple sugar transport system substrate-binding protein